MKVFISWSGTTSRAVAEALSDWLPKVLQGIEPFVSAKDIDKGANWTVELARELENSDFGIVCLAPDNLLSPWLNYEAGAITKSVDSRVCPVLFEVEKSQVKAPISQLQLTSLDRTDFLMLMASMNKVAGNLLTTESLKETVEVWWPQLESAIKAIAKPKATTTPGVSSAAEPAKPAVDLTEMLEEVLHRVRGMDSRVTRMERAGRAGSRTTGSRSSADVIGTRTSEFMMLLTKNDLLCNSASRSNSSFTFDVEGDLPEVLPTEIFNASVALAKEFGFEVRVHGKNRTAAFERDGSTVEF